MTEDKCLCKHFVYCFDCEHLQHRNCDDGSKIYYTGKDAICEHPNSYSDINTPIRPGKSIQLCKKRNEKNDCKDFKQRFVKTGHKITKRFLGIPIKREPILEPVVSQRS